jgi:hypothetical protein
MRLEDVAMPERVAALDRDKRGYPIPFVVFREADGTPDFVVNDAAKTWRCALDMLCHVCGTPHGPNPWFGGGPGNALLNGDVAVYIDGPMHHECLHYALQACPHLAGKLLKPVQLQAVQQRLAGQGVRTVDNTVVAGVPAVFVAVQAWVYRVDRRQEHLVYEVLKPFRKTEYWAHGAMLPRDEGEREAKRWARKVARELKT